MTIRDERIPPVIGEKLVQLLKRLRHILLFKGLTITVSTFLVAMLAAITLDRLLVMPTMVRVLISVAAVVVTLLTAYIYWLKPCLRRPDEVSLAATVEEQHPELQERVSSTIEFIADEEERPEFRGSEEMRHAVIEQAAEAVKPVDFPEVVSAERARKSTMTAGFLLLVTLCIAALWWTDFRQLFHRFAMPWANIARVSTTQITVNEPADKLVAKGESVHIAAIVTPKSVDEASLYVEIEPDRWIPVKMTSAEAGSFSHRLTDVNANMRYYIRAGDAVTRYYSITVVPRPQLTRVDLHYTYPAYTRLKAKEELDAPGDIRAVVGTEVTLTVTASKHVDVARLEMTGLSQPMEMQPVGPRQYQAKFPLTTGGLYVPRFQDEFGFTNQDEEVRQVIADPDARPVVKISQPERNIKLHWASRIPVAIEVTDDFGVNELAIVYSVDEGEEKEFPVEFVGVGSPEVTRTYHWGLAALKLRPGNIITYRAKAVDNLPPKPNVGFSAAHTILITSPQYDVDKDVRQQQLERIRRAMAKLKEQLNTARQQVTAMKKSADEKQPIQEWQDRSKETAQKSLKDAEPTAKELTELLRKDPLLDALTPKAEDIETKHVPEAQKATDDVQANRPLELSQKPIEKAKEELDEAVRKLDEMAEEMKRLEAQEDEERKIAELADKENKLAAEADKVTPEQQELAGQLAEKQDALKDMLDKLMDQNLRQDAMQQGMDEFNQMRQDVKDLLGREKDLKGRTEEAIRKKLDELKQRQKDLNRDAEAARPDVQPKLDQRQAGPMPQDEMKKALEAMEGNKLAEAVNQQQKAEERMRAQADALAKPAAAQQDQAEKPPAPQEAARVNELAEEQENIRRELAALAGIPQLDRQLEDVLRKQEALKKEAEALEQRAEPQVDKQQPRGDRAPEEMQQAVNEMKRQTPRQALPHQEEAAKQMDQLAQNLDKQAEAGQPEAGAPEPKQLAQNARDLAQKQRDLQQELENALPPQDAAMEQLAQEQQELEMDARDMGAQMEEMAGALEQVLPQVGPQARRTQKAMQQAPQHMEAAAEDLEAGQAEPATGDEQKAIDALEQADAESGKLGQELAQAVGEMMGQHEPGHPSAALSLAKALAQMKDASGLMRQMETQQGTQQMQQAAQHLASAAEHMMQHPGQPHMSQNLNPKGIRGVGRKVEDLDQLKELKLTAEEWNRLPGELKQQLLQAMNGRYPEEYRQLIRDYFRRLAKTGIQLDRGK